MQNKIQKFCKKQNRPVFNKFGNHFFKIYCAKFDENLGIDSEFDSASIYATFGAVSSVEMLAFANFSRGLRPRTPVSLSFFPLKFRPS